MVMVLAMKDWLTWIMVMFMMKVVTANMTIMIMKNFRWYHGEDEGGDSKYDDDYEGRVKKR